MINSQLIHYAQLMRWHRPVGILLLLWPTLTALWIAGEGHPSWHVVCIFTLGVIIMRSAGCVINDIADRKKDGFVQRTCSRPLVTKKVSLTEAFLLFAGLLLIALVLVLLTNPITIKLSFIAVMLAVIYPFMKRVTHFPQVVLGAAFGWAIPMAFAAQTQQIPLTGWLLFVATVLWAVVYDTQYGMADREEDLKIGVKSTAILFGQYDKMIVGILQALVLLLLWIIGDIQGLGSLYHSGLVCALILAIYQQWLIRDREPKACFDAFLNNQWFGMVIFLGILAEYWRN